MQKSSSPIRVPNYTLFTPGPVQIPSEVLKEISEPMIHHRTKEFEAIFRETIDDLKQIFETEQRVFIQTATGSGAMESAIVNTLSPGEKVICINTGKFGERWVKMAKTFGLQVIELRVPWGHAVNSNDVDSALRLHPDARALFCQACETSTGVLNPIREIAQIKKSYPDLLLIVDAITALGVIQLPMDAWGIDVMVAASQKALMLPTGLGILAFSKKAWQACLDAKGPRFYWDLRNEDNANTKDQTMFSSSVALIRGLRIVLKRLLKMGLLELQSKTLEHSEETRNVLSKMGFTPFSYAPSPSISAFTPPPGIDGEALQTRLQEEFFICVAGGQDDFKGKILRIGHMGALTKEDYQRLFLALFQILKGNPANKLMNQRELQQLVNWDVFR